MSYMVSRLRVLLWIGIIVLFLPFFGVPDTIRAMLTIAIGVVLIYMTFSLKRAYKKLKFELRQGTDQPTTIHE